MKWAWSHAKRQAWLPLLQQDGRGNRSDANRSDAPRRASDHTYPASPDLMHPGGHQITLTQLHLCVLGQQHILALDVAVDHVMDVEMGQALQARHRKIYLSDAASEQSRMHPL